MRYGCPQINSLGLYKMCYVCQLMTWRMGNQWTVPSRLGQINESYSLGPIKWWFEVLCDKFEHHSQWHLFNAYYSALQ